MEGMHDVGSGQAKPGISQTVDFGISVQKALPAALGQLGGKRVLLVMTDSPGERGALAERMERILSSSWVDTIGDICAQPSWSDVLRIANALRSADTVVSLGDAPLCDAVKMARLCVANQVWMPRNVEGFRVALRDRSIPLCPARPKFIAIATALAASEFTPMARIIDEDSGEIETFHAAAMAPDHVILDPEMTLTTSSRRWFSTGIRAVDHAIGNWCSVNRTPLSNATALHALRLLLPALRQVREYPDHLGARLECMSGAWLSIQGVVAGVDAGASYGIGYALWSAGDTSHEEASYVMLPHVLRYNAKVNANRQKELLNMLGIYGSNLGDIIQDLINDLKLPARLRDAGVVHAELDNIARDAMANQWVHTNPRRLTSQSDVLKLLQSAW